MSVYLCRWANSDISLVIGNNRLAIDEILDEVGNPDGAELIRIKHPVAVHFHLKKQITSEVSVPECLEFEGVDERSYSEICSAYPVLHAALCKEDATEEQIAAALQQEKERVHAGSPDLSDAPKVALFQLQTNMPKRLVEHYKEVARTNAHAKD